MFKRNGYYVTVETLANGDLILIPQEEIQELAECENFKNMWAIAQLWEILEDVICNSELEIIPPEKIGALTESPILGLVEYDPDTDKEDYTAVWWFPEYCYVSEIEELIEGKTVVFTKA